MFSSSDDKTPHYQHSFTVPASFLTIARFIAKASDLSTPITYQAKVLVNHPILPFQASHTFHIYRTDYFRAYGYH